jgi:hypothetical protein
MRAPGDFLTSYCYRNAASLDGARERVERRGDIQHFLDHLIEFRVVLVPFKDFSLGRSLVGRSIEA